MASLFDLGQITNLKINDKGLREVMRSSGMQASLVSTAADLAGILNATNDGTYDYGPIGEPVTSAVGAHAFVRTADQVSRIEQARRDTLNEVIGG